MYANIRPDIARVAEQTVVNLKQLESCIEVVKNDLAALCVQVGHPEAARLAATPVQWLGSPNAAFGATGALGSFSPFAAANIAPNFFANPFGSPFANASPFASPFGVSPFGVSPYLATSPLATFSPFATPSFAQGTPLTIR